MDTEKKISILQTKPMWQKSREKKMANKRHARNFDAGHIKIDEHHLHRSGLRGRKRWFLWCGLFIMLLVVLLNLAVNCLLLVVLRITPFGLPYMIFWSNGVVFLQNFNSSVVQAQNDILSYQNHSINLSSSNSVEVNLGSSKVVLTNSTVLFRPYESFSVYNRNGSRALFVNDSTTVFPSLKPFPHLNTTSLTTPEVLSSRIYSNQNAAFEANKKLKLQSKATLKAVSSKSIRTSFRDLTASFIVQSKDGILLNELPSYYPSVDDTNEPMTDGYQLCICGNGKLFRVPVSCAQANENIDPCL